MTTPAPQTRVAPPRSREEPNRSDLRPGDGPKPSGPHAAIANGRAVRPPVPDSMSAVHPATNAVTRRDLLRAGLPLGLGVVGLSFVAATGAWSTAHARVASATGEGRLAVTPSMTEGPYYPEQWSGEPSVSLRRPGLGAPAKPMTLAGRVIGTDGRPLAGARVEIWQCDAYGRYHHSRDSRPDERDPDFAGYGWQFADADGGYRFETIRPVPYPGRTPHVHVLVAARGRHLLTSQIFMPDEAEANRADFLYRRLAGDARALLTATLDGTVAGEPVVRFDLVVAPA